MARVAANAWGSMCSYRVGSGPRRTSGTGPLYPTGALQEDSMEQQKYSSCIEACNACADACDMCAAACLREDDVKAMARCIALDIDCAQMCRLAAGAMARDSEVAAAICDTCATICEMCADECAKHPMQHCQDCANACRRCADECRRMSGMAARP